MPNPAAVIVTIGCAMALALSTAGATSAGTQGYGLQLVVPVQGGLVGWCMIYQTPNRSGAKCPVVPSSDRPIVAESWAYNPRPDVTEAIALTTSAVNAVSVPGGPSSVLTHTEAGLPYGLRAAFVEIPGGSASGSRPLLTPLSAAGQRVAGLAPTTTPSGYYLRSRAWRSPGHAPKGACAISTTALSGLIAQSGRVVVHLVSFTGLIGRPFLSCTDTQFTLNGSPLDAGVVLDATHPGTAPAALPGMKPLPGHSGVFQALGWNAPLLGRRTHNAWLVVEGGSSAQQRLTVLEHLHASVKA
jgi:hypothetical protein